MKLDKLKIKGLMLVKTKIHKDKRGFFKENYKNKLMKKKFVFDVYYTSAGVSAGIDMSLDIVRHFFGKTIAKNTAKFMEYNY